MLERPQNVVSVPGEKLSVILRRKREEIGLTQSGLAELCGLAPNYVARLEGGDKSHPRFETVAAIASALGLSLDELAVQCGYRRDSALSGSDASAALALVAPLEGLISRLDDVSSEAAAVVKALERASGRTKKRIRV